MTRIAILCPTRGRPEQCKRMVESVRNTSTKGNVKVFLSTSDDEANKSGYAYSVGDNYVLFPDWPTVMSWNKLAEWAMKIKDIDLFMLGADDIIFSTPCWDDFLIDHYNSLKEKIHCYAFQDSRDKDGVPHYVVTREWIEALGYFAPPIFLHWKIDIWTSAIAKANGVFMHARDFLLTHDKPSDRGNPDETFSRIRKQGWRERDQYVADTCQYFLEAEKLRLDNYLRQREAA